jgi:transposase, IS5 family
MRLFNYSFRYNFPLKHRDQRIFWIIQHIYDQQKWMYDNNKKSISSRIVNIYQPWVRPIVRGKEKSNVEFGSKINISEIDGFTKLNRLSWDAYNESEDVVDQIEDFLNTFGRYPELLLADQIYLTRKNRAYLKEKGIRIVGKPLGRPSPNILSAYQKRKQRKERNLRNHVEGKFGQGKNAYGLNQIRAKRMDTSVSWIAAIFFVMNLIRLVKLINIYFWLKSKIYNIVYSLKETKINFIISFNRISLPELIFLRVC